MEAIKAKIGDIGVCKQGYTGLILSEKNGLFRGVHLGRLKLGKKWESKDPQIIGNIHEMILMSGVK